MRYSPGSVPSQGIRQDELRVREIENALREGQILENLQSAEYLTQVWKGLVINLGGTYDSLKRKALTGGVLTGYLKYKTRLMGVLVLMGVDGAYREHQFVKRPA